MPSSKYLFGHGRGQSKRPKCFCFAAENRPEGYTAWVTFAVFQNVTGNPSDGGSERPASTGRRCYRRKAASCARIRHAVTCLSQRFKHLLSFVPPLGLAHLPTQFAALFSHRGASSTASAGELWSTPMPMRTIAKKRGRVIVEPPEKVEQPLYIITFPGAL
jgi:hypothetical protein